jgi:hypothetical protein
MDNFVNCLGSPNAEMARVISSQASYEEGSTTIPKGSRAKWSEAQSTLWGEDIVWSLQKCRAALKQCGGKLTTCHEHQTNELKRDQEFNLVGVNNTGVAGNNTTIRETASLSAWIGTNVSHGTNGASPGGGTAATDGTQRAMTEAMLKSVMQLAWTQGGSPNYLLVGPHVKTVVSGFAGIAEQRYMAPSDGPTTIIGAADVYVSDFGAISIVPSRFSRARDAYLIDKELVTLATLRPMQSQELAKTGDATKYMLLVEYGLQVNNEKGLGAVYDLSTS